MRLGMAISNLSAHGGLQRDCISVARHLVAAGHDVTILTTEIRGAATDPGCNVHLVKSRVPTNPGRDIALGKTLLSRRRDFDRIVGFNKLPVLDIYYSGDRSYAAVKTGFWRPFSPRYRAQMQLEQACFEPRSRTSLIMLTAHQQNEYQRVWDTPDSRFRRISPNLDPARRLPGLRTDGTRQRLRSELGIREEAPVWLSIGSSAWVKGFDRVAAALAAHPKTIWLVCGIVPNSDMARWLQAKIAARDRQRVIFAGIRSDVSEMMAAADILLHPARIETTGTVILEALANGLPVIASETCGFAAFVEQADAGAVLKGTYQHGNLMDALAVAQSAGQLAAWSAGGARFGANPTLSNGHSEAAKLFAGDLW